MRKLLAIAILATLVLVAGAASAVASIPDAGGIIHGCRNSITRIVTIVDSPSQSCLAGTTEVNWSQLGPIGPAGPQGVAGPTGPRGGVSETVESATAFSVGPASAGGGAVACPAGTTVIGGGISVNPDSPLMISQVDYVTESSRPIKSLNGYDGFIYNRSPGTLGLVVHALCIES